MLSHPGVLIIKLYQLYQKKKDQEQAVRQRSHRPYWKILPQWSTRPELKQTKVHHSTTATKKTRQMQWRSQDFFCVKILARKFHKILRNNFFLQWWIFNGFQGFDGNLT
jgi:hypothetical protein